MNQEYSLHITHPEAGLTTAEMTITGYIKQDENNGAAFEQSINELADTYKEIIVNVINLYGGSTYDGMVIRDSIFNCKAATTTLTKGLSASMGVPISLAGNKSVLMAENSRLMLHRARNVAAGNADDLRNEAKNLDEIESELAVVISARCGETPEFVKENYMNKGDLYLTAVEAKAAKLIDDVVPSNIFKDVPKNILKLNQPQAVADYYQKQIFKPNNTMKEIAIAVSALQIANPEFKASQETEVIAEITAQSNRLKIAEAKVIDLEAKTKKAEEDKAISLVEAALLANKIDKKQQAHFEKMAKADYESVKAILDGMEAHVPISERMKDKPKTDPYAGWDWDKLTKEAPQELGRIKEEDPERFAEIKKAKFNQ